MKITPTQYDQDAAGMAAAVEQITDHQERAKAAEGCRAYLERIASEQIERYTRAARNALFFAKVDREAGDRAAAAWDLWSAAQHRRNAAEWIARYNRVAARGEV